MYIPAAFAVTDLPKLHEFIEQNSFGLLVSQLEGRPFASHLPFLLDRERGPHGTLIGHLARANPHWQHAAGQPALAIFAGPHAYISPAWYDAEQVVPTWNYVSVHASGPVEILDDQAAVLEIVERFVSFYEQTRPQPWAFDGSTTFAKRMLTQIVGLRMPIETLEGKWKLNQNHPVDRRRKVVQALWQQDDENSQAIADLMAGMIPDDDRIPD